MSNEQNRRKYFRLHYPICERPRLIADFCEFLTLEISEGGARIRYSPNSTVLFVIPTPVRIVFHNGEIVNTTALRLRREPGQLILKFVHTIPTKIMFQEQRRLIVRYPNLFGSERGPKRME